MQLIYSLNIIGTLYNSDEEWLVISTKDKRENIVRTSNENDTQFNTRGKKLKLESCLNNIKGHSQ